VKFPVVTIGDVCQQIRGVSYKGGEAVDAPQDGYLPILRANNISDEGISYDDLVFVPQKYVSKTQLLQKNDIVIAASSGSLNIVGKAAPIKGNFNGSFGAFCKVLRPNSDADPEYLAYFFKTPFYRHTISNLAAGANINNLRNEHLDNLKVLLPPLKDQQKCVRLLSKAESALEKRRETLRLADEFLKSAFLDMFGDPVRNDKGWDVYKGEEDSDLITVGVVVKPASYYVDKGVIALRSLNIKPNRICLENIVYFSKEANRGPLAKSTLKQGDVVVVRTGSTGTAAVIPPELDGSNCIDLIIIRPKVNMLNSFYLTFLLNSDIGKRMIASKEVGGIQKHFNVGAIKSIRIPLPPIGDQRKFAGLVQKVERLKEKQKQSETELQNLFNALMQRAFKGEL
jgi:type I restriction enzyme, S subunit